MGHHPHKVKRTGFRIPIDPFNVFAVSDSYMSRIVYDRLQFSQMISYFLHLFPETANRLLPADIVPFSVDMLLRFICSEVCSEDKLAERILSTEMDIERVHVS